MVKVILIFILVAILMEDGSSMRKSEEERKEDEEVARAVNATLAEEEKKRQEEEKKKEQVKTQDEKKEKKDDKTKGKKEDRGKERNVGDKDEACPPVNASCPEVQECGPCAPCGPCPEEKICPECPEERPCRPCRPCGPCPVVNATVDQPPTINCPEVAAMSVPVAMAVGAAATLLAAGVAAVLGLLLRYFSPLECGFLFLATIIIVWYLSSHYPDTARELGGRVVEVLREATTTLSHRVVEALQRHNEQVVFLNKPSLLKNEFHVSKSLH
jgi:hypothetical protein